jgi:hypothetical protein
MRLTEEQKSLLETSLRIAADKFRENSNVCTNPSLNQTGLGDVFRRQAAQTDALISLFENSDYVEVKE